tara:strand:- start:12 stop:554 length:543 start_codon:yes stop_codon:yes gene_type:complete
MHKFYYDKYYFIDHCDIELLSKQGKKTNIILRNYSKNFTVKEVLNLKNFCKKKQFKLFISNNIKLAMKLNLDGAYFPSFNKDFKHLSYNLKKEFLLIGSAHNASEARIKLKQKVKLIFLSSIFKRNKNYLGLYRFINLVNIINSKVIALGGISKQNYKLLKFIKIKGFSGISFFQKKRPL